MLEALLKLRMFGLCSLYCLQLDLESFEEVVGSLYFLIVGRSGLSNLDEPQILSEIGIPAESDNDGWVVHDYFSLYFDLAHVLAPLEVKQSSHHLLQSI